MVIISSFYNEAYLLPWWLKHHKQIFEHGILINYYSTDNSIKIIKDICPTWEVRNTRNKDWDPITNDKEFMDIEKEVNSHKIVLTTTEFLVGELSLSNKLECLAIPIVRMVDVEPENEPSYNQPLIKQKNVGYKAKINNYRFLHNYPDGNYIGAGRHKTKHNVSYPEDSFIYKYIYSPWNKYTIQRRLQMVELMSKRHLNHKHWGRHHKMSREQLVQNYEQELKYIK